VQPAGLEPEVGRQWFIFYSDDAEQEKEEEEEKEEGNPQSVSIFFVFGHNHFYLLRR
jgi:hypothetical protein